MTRATWVLLLAAAVATALMASGLWTGPSVDASVFSTVGWRLSQGEALYREIWDHKPPGLYLPYAIASLLTGPTSSWSVVWVLSVLSVVGLAVACWRLLVRVGVDQWGAAAAASLGVFGAGSYLLSLGGGMGETLALAPMALAVIAATRSAWLVAGAMTGIALLVSLQVAPMLAGLAVIGAWGSEAGAGRRAVAGLGGLTAIVGVVIVWLALTDALGPAFDAVVTYSAAYRAVTTEGAARSVWSLVPWTVLVLLPLLAAAGFAVIHRRRLADPRLAVASAAWLATAVALVALQGRFYAHYATPLVMPLALLAGLGLNAGLNRARGRAGGAVLLAPLAITVLISLAAGAAGAADEQRTIGAHADRITAVASELDPGSASDPTLLVWGNDARLYEASRLPPAIRYPYLYPLLTPGYATEELVGRLLETLEERPPAFVVDAGSLDPGEPGLPPLLMDRPVATDGRSLDLLDPLRAFVDERYELLEIIRGWPVYALREGQTAP